MVYAIIFCVRISNLVFIHPVVWYGTNISQTAMRSRLHFNPLPPYGMRRLLICFFRCLCMISIHASRMGCDYWYGIFGFGTTDFNPRTPYGMRHSGSTYITVTGLISIHAPRMGCDSMSYTIMLRN